MVHSTTRARVLTMGLDWLSAAVITLTSLLWSAIPQQPSAHLRTLLGQRLTPLDSLFACLLLLAWSIFFKTLHQHQPPRSHGEYKLLMILRDCTILTLTLFLYLLSAPGSRPALRVSSFFWLCSVGYEAARILGIGGISGRRALRHPEVLVILGVGPKAAMVWRRIRVNYHDAVSFLGFVDTRLRTAMSPDIALRHLGGIDDLEGLLAAIKVDRLVLALEGPGSYEPESYAARVATRAGVQVSNTFDFMALYPELPVHSRITKFWLAGCTMGAILLWHKAAPPFLHTAHNRSRDNP